MKKTKKYFIRRIAALFYDLLLLCGMIILTVAILVAFHGRAFLPDTVWLQILILIMIASYFSGFWYFCQGTPGMHAWGLTLIAVDVKKITLLRSMLRFFIAAISIIFFGVSFIWLLFDKNNQSLHDRIMRTVVVRKS